MLLSESDKLTHSHLEAFTRISMSSLKVLFSYNVWAWLVSCTVPMPLVGGPPERCGR